MTTTHHSLNEEHFSEKIDKGFQEACNTPFLNFPWEPFNPSAGARGKESLQWSESQIWHEVLPCKSNKFLLPNDSPSSGSQIFY